jgi:uncharacterized protein YndB with AHSA1/START domain
MPDDRAANRMVQQQFSQLINASAERVYRALLDPRLIERWRVPTGMQATVHEFDARVGGRFRVSLTYEDPEQIGKTSSRTDTYHGHFVELVPAVQVEEVLEFETAVPEMQGKMRILTTLEATPTGTMLVATHSGLPPAISMHDNETGWRDSLQKLARLVEDSEGGN